jgi:4-hydroxybenzoate polyprenyltransferase
MAQDIQSEKMGPEVAESQTGTNSVKKAGLSYHLYTIWLITANDIKSIVLPETAFGIFSALAGSALTTNSSPALLDILGRLPKVIFWNWINCLLFDIANQRLPSSILEDSVNKPWRVIPSGRISAANMRRLLLIVIIATFITSLVLGGMYEAVAMMVLTWMYNDLEGADENYLVRNVINAFGFMCYSSGSTIVAAGFGTYELNSRAFIWLCMVGGIVFSTLQMQDMPDVIGDAARDRRTLPLVHGDTVARWSIAICVTMWSIVCPYYWNGGLIAYLLACGSGGLLVFRLMLYRTVQADAITWKIWCLWTTLLYLLPLVQNPQVFINLL